jgi:hypothetical protein
MTWHSTITTADRNRAAAITGVDATYAVLRHRAARRSR